MKVDVGTVRNNLAGYSRLTRLAYVAKDLFAEKIVLDFSSCKFFEANMTAPLQTVIAGLFDRLNDVELVNFRETTERILRENKFLVLFNRGPFNQE